MTKQGINSTKLLFQPAQLSGQIITSQVAYPTSLAGLQTAQKIIALKLRNSRNILTNFRQARVRAGDLSLAKNLQDVQAQLQALSQQTSTTTTIRDIFLIEARAAHIYWQTMRILCQQSSTWQRVHPHAQDPLNIILNTGYTILARVCREAIITAGLLPQLGILHGYTSSQPLVYDFMELFRQPAVDAVIIPVFSRKQRKWERLPKQDMRRGYKKLYDIYDKRLPYNGRCEKLATIIYREAIQLRKAIRQQNDWQPYKYPWRHYKKCD